MSVPLSSIISSIGLSSAGASSIPSVLVSSSVSSTIPTAPLASITSQIPSSSSTTTPRTSSKEYRSSSSTVSSSSSSSTSTASSSATSSTSTPSSTAAASPFQAVGGPAGLAGIATASIVVIIIIVVLGIYCCRKRDRKSQRKSRPESKRSTLAGGSRVGPWRWNVSGTPSPDDDVNRKSRRTTTNTVHKELPEIVVLDARPSTDNSTVSLPYAMQQGPLHLTMPYTPPDDLLSTRSSKSDEELPPERYIPYVAPKQKRSSSTLPQNRRSSMNNMNQYPNGPQGAMPRQPGTNSVSAAVPSSQRTSLVMADNPYAQPRHHGRSSSASSSVNQTSQRVSFLPAPIVIPPKGVYPSRYQSPHHSPATVTEETESELGDLGDDDREMDMTEADSRTRRDRTSRQKLNPGELYAHMHALGEWDGTSRSSRYDGDSENDPGHRAPAKTRGRYTEEMNGARF